MVGYISTFVAGLLLIIQIIRLIVESAIAAAQHNFQAQSLTQLIGFFIESIVLIVVAVPEGLPLAVTISLAYSMQSMLKDNNLVRYLAACETMGSATNICSDKTGTLTENRMTITRAWFGGKLFSEDLTNVIPQTLSKEFIQLFCSGVSINSTSDLKFVKKEGKEFTVS